MSIFEVICKVKIESEIFVVTVFLMSKEDLNLKHCVCCKKTTITF